MVLPSFGRAAPMAAVVFAACAVWIMLGWGGDQVLRNGFDVILTVLPLVVGMMVWRIGTAATGRLARGWKLMGAAVFAWGVGQGAWSFLEIVLVQEPFPSVADVGYLLFIPLAALSLGTFIGFNRNTLLGVRSALDGLVIALGLLFVVWTAFLGDVYAAGAVSATAQAIGLAYPVGDIAVLTMAALLAVRTTPAGRASDLLLLAGIVLMAVSDSLFAILTLHESYETGQFVDLGWLAAFLVIGLAALHPSARVQPPDPLDWRPTRAAVSLPYIVLGFGVLAASLEQALAGQIEAFLIWNAIAFVVAIAARQLVLSWDNVRLIQSSNEALAALGESERLRTQLLNTITHDLANPLSPIRLQVRLLQSQDLSESQQASVRILDTNARQLDRLIRDLADLAKSQAHRLVVEPRPVDLDAVVRDVTLSFQAEAMDRHVLLTVDVLPTRVTADDQRIRQVMANLLSNALKFSQPGNRIDVSCISNRTVAQVRVKDEGRGLAPDELGRLFQPFTQVHARGEIPERGTGLGLYICRAIVEAHGGIIHAASSGRGQGATFTFEIPLATTTTAAPAP